eukprot:3027464-Lingulodinium_polyedra.AAC.1
MPAALQAEAGDLQCELEQDYALRFSPPKNFWVHSRSPKKHNPAENAERGARRRADHDIRPFLFDGAPRAPPALGPPGIPGPATRVLAGVE